MASSVDASQKSPIGACQGWQGLAQARSQLKMMKSEEQEAIEAKIDSKSDNKSSSTEGPDSQPHSSSSSPVSLGDIMVPVYPDHPDQLDHEAESDVLLPLFTAKISQDQVNKDGDSVRYKIRVKKLDAKDERELNIEREYDDFEFLHHTLTTHNQVS